MRMVLLIAAALPLTAATKPVTAPLKPCARPQAEPAGMRKPVRVRPLAEMPPGKQIKGVYRSVDGCATLLVVREQVGQRRR